MATTIEFNKEQSKAKAREILALADSLTSQDLAELITELRKMQLNRNMGDQRDTTSV